MPTRWLIVVALALSGAALSSAEPRGVVEVAADWRFVTGGRIRHAPAVSADGTIYCVADDRVLRAVGPGGRELWRIPLGARPAASPLVAADGSIHVLTTDGLLRCLGPQGKLRWSRSLDTDVVADMACARDGGLYLALRAGMLLAVDYRGRDRWSFRFKADIVAPPSVAADGTLYVSTADRLFHALSPDGAQIWTLALPADGGAAAVGSTGIVYVSAFGIHAVAPDGRLLWELPIPYATTDPVVAADPAGLSLEIVVVGARNGRLHVADAGGARVEEIEIGGSVLHPPVARADGSLVVVTSDGLLRVRPGAAEDAVALLRPKEPMSAPVLMAGGFALAGSEDWVLYGCSFGDSQAGAGQARAAAQYWPQPRHDAARTGRAGAGAESTGVLSTILSELAASPLVEHKEQVLEDIRAHFEGRAYLSLSAAEMEGLLVFLALEGVQSPVYIGERRTTDHPTLRGSACELLGELGTEGGRRTLVAVVEKDPRGEVQSRAAEALGIVGYDPDGGSSRALLLMAERRASEEGALLVAVRALRGVASASGPMLGLGDAVGTSTQESPARPAWGALVALAGDRYPERVRTAARMALAELLGK